MASVSLLAPISKPYSSIKNLKTPAPVNLRFHQWTPSLLFNSPTSALSLKPHSLRSTKPRSRTTTITSLFTGIVEEIGEVRQIGRADPDSFTLKIGAKTVLEGVRLGDSIAVNGTCLTVTEFDTGSSGFSAGVAPETLRKTSLGELERGSRVNLERALTPSTRMGGHFVQGHVDGTGEIVGFESEGDSLWVRVKTTKELLRYIVPKGFIAVDGVSLTVVEVFEAEECFNFMLVDYTQKNIVLPSKKIGEKVNLEVDILGKYVQRLLNTGFIDSIKSPASQLHP
ncbi:unnamed protein product [Cuscuta campestris]|uniref:Riboflavin synthase n=1 Tax=Cuscuta campestris TaxID=132261 RepID=A0A484MZ72_9ASTE|nr:unnamed protein product [Cuscuta campestris]